MLLTGTFKRSVDEKQRIAIPKKLRSAFLDTTKATTETASKSNTKAGLFIAPGTDGSLAIYTEESFSRLAEKLSDGSPTGQDRRAFSRMFYARAQRVEMDGQGRVRIDPELVKLAGLQSECVLVGVGDRLELWDASRWEKYQAEQQAKFDELAEGAFRSDG